MSKTERQMTKEGGIDECREMIVCANLGFPALSAATASGV
jgi:hypothetical protein